MRTMVLVVAAVTCACGFPATVLIIDDFEYADVAAARAAWVQAESSEPAELIARETEDGGKTALKMPCNFTLPRYAQSSNNPRAVYDRKVNLDLTNYGSIVFDFYCEDPAPIRNCTIYFHSAAGWYGRGFNPNKGWNRVVLGKAEFGSEDKPGGWASVDTIRVCAWQGKAADTFCAIDNLHARTEDIAVVKGDAEGPEGGTVQQCAEDWGGWLSAMGVPYGSFSEKDVASGVLSTQKLAVFPYNPGMNDETVAAIEKYVAAGGKVLMVYSIRQELAAMLGVGPLTYKGRGREGQFADIVFDQEALPGVPATVAQDSWNVNLPRLGPGVQTVGWWQDREGERGEPAVVVGENGAYIGHILTSADNENKRLLVLALVGHFVPDAWKEAASKALTTAATIGPFRDRAALEEYLRTMADKVKATAEIRRLLGVADQEKQAATDALAAGAYPEVLHRAAAMRTALSEAYQHAHTSRDGEFRAVWNHSGTGDCGSWDEAMRLLSEANFNAVVPNMWWAGVAHYDSEYLPHSKTFEDRGDQIAQAVEAGKKYGIQVHPWKVNWNLSNAPKEFVDKLREEGRLQARANGEERAWLCPSHPDNFKLELDTMLEVVRKYDVDGVHFDYIRYPDGDSCYCDGCRERFEAQIGRKVEDWPADCVSGELRVEWRQFRCDQITRLVRATSEQARQIKPHIQISAAVFGSYPETRNSIGQDWVLWCREGWLDFVCPMNYTENDTYFENVVKRQVGYVGGVVPLYAGIGHWRIPDDQAIGQMETARQLGADGFILFNMGETLARKALPAFGAAITSEKAVLPHNAPLVRFSSPADDESQIVAFGGDSAEITARVESMGPHRVAPRLMSGKFVLETMGGEAIRELGDLPAVGEQVTLTVTRVDEPFRIAAKGEFTLADGTKQPFIRRSRPYQFAK